MIRLDHVSKRYADVRRPAVDDLTLDIPDGEIVVLLGPSGCGKSTTIRMINRLVEPDSGSVILDGVDVRTLAPEELRRGIGYAIQGVGLFPHWTVKENIGTVPRLLGWDRERIDARVAELLDLVGLADIHCEDSYPSQLSGGEAQRVGVARALAADPPVLLMDEPFGAVDPLTRDKLQREFLEIQSRLGKTVVFVTHDIDEAVRLGDRVAIMRAGRLVQYDTPERVLAYPADDFVGGFVGDERAIKRLALASLAEVQGPVSEAPSDAPFGVPEGATLRYALAKLLEAGQDVLPVTDDNGRVVGSISLENVMSHFRKPIA